MAKAGRRVGAAASKGRVTACQRCRRAAQPTRATVAHPALQCWGYVSASGSKCAATNPWVHYCARCGALPTACTECTRGRALEGGQCSLSCKALWGIGCLQCTAAGCTAPDPAFPQGYRR